MWTVDNFVILISAAPTHLIGCSFHHPRDADNSILLYFRLIEKYFVRASQPLASDIKEEEENVNA